LTHKAQQVGYHPEVILAGRRLNDNMGRYIASEVVKLMLRKRIQVADAKILILGLTFKENCPDLRNTRVIDIIDELITYGATIEVHDPWAAPGEAERLYGVTMINELPEQRYDAVVLAVAHREFTNLGRAELARICRPQAVIYDVKHLLAKGLADGSL
jgi:UDP-N-acetyl-D-galactosamine dehydrogenase